MSFAIRATRDHSDAKALSDSEKEQIKYRLLLDPSQRTIVAGDTVFTVLNYGDGHISVLQCKLEKSFDCTERTTRLDTPRAIRESDRPRG